MPKSERNRPVVAELISDSVVCEEGKPLSPESARILAIYAFQMKGWREMTSLQLKI